jgi:hypothetical protein
LVVVGLQLDPAALDPAGSVQLLDGQADAVIGGLAERRLGARSSSRSGDEDRVSRRDLRGARRRPGCRPDCPRRICRLRRSRGGGRP